MYDDLVEKLIEVDEAAVATKVSPEKKMMRIYKGVSKKLVKSSFSDYEEGRCKFWLLTNGMLIPVKKNDTHNFAAQYAGTEINSLLAAGTIRGYVKKNDEMGIHWESGKSITPKQRSVLRNLFIEYKIDTVHWNPKDDFITAFPKSSEEFDYLITYGKSATDESIDEAIEVPEYLYHGTFKPLLKRIKSEGLKTTGTVKNYSDSEVGLVYLAKTFEEAEAFAEVSETVPDEWIDQIVVLRIETDKLDKSKLADDPNVRDTEVMTFIYSQDIPADAFTVMVSRSGLDETGYMGITEAGWIHPNGEFEEIPNYIMGDHDKDAFEKMYPGRVWSFSFGRDLTEPYIRYLESGHIRYMQSHRGFNIEVGKKPTESQMRAIRKGIEENEAGEFYFSTRLVGGYVEDGSSWKEFTEVVRKMS